MSKAFSGQISKNELKKFVKNIDLILRGKVGRAVIARDKRLIVKLATLELGCSKKFGLNHILKHVNEKNITIQDIYRLAELISTASERVKIKSKVYYGKSQNPLISNLVVVVADNPDIGRVITTMRMRPKQLREIF